MSLATQGVIPQWGENVPGVPVLLPYVYGSGLGGGQIYPHAAGGVDLLAARASATGAYDDRPAVERELRDTISGRSSQGQGGSFRLRPGWPKMDQLDYVQKFTTASLLTLGLLLLVGYAIHNPGGAVAMVVRGAKSRAGVR